MIRPYLLRYAATLSLSVITASSGHALAQSAPAAPAAPGGATPPGSNPPATGTPEDDAALEDDAEETPVEPSAPGSSDSSPPAASAVGDAAEGMDEELLAEEDPARPPAKGKGVIWGVVTDTKFDEPIIEGPVMVVGTKYQTITDVDGRFRLELPPGTYTLRFSYELHQSGRVDGVRVATGNVVRVDGQLTPDEKAVAETEIVTEADKTSVEGHTLERKRSAAVSDGVGRAEIAKTPDRNAAEAARRVVGATIVGERFVFVRGLGERYTNAALNGSPLPSPEPDRNSIPLDLFPSLVLDSITIAKTFTPDVPADFAGGAVRIFTRQLPRETLFQVGLNLGFNTASTFRDRLTYSGSGTDWLGYDSGKRRLPRILPNYVVRRGTIVPGSETPDNPAGRELTGEEAASYGQRVNSPMSTLRKGTPPNFGLSVVAGDSFKLGREVKFGALGALSYGRSYVVRRNEIIRSYKTSDDGGNELETPVDLKSELGIDRVRWGAFGSATLEINPRHRLSLLGLHSQSADDESRELEGDYEAPLGRYHSTRLTYVSRALDFVQLRGEHDFPALLNAQLNWYGSLAGASRDQPDTRSNVYSYAAANNPPVWAFSDNPQSGSHFFAEQSERSRGAGLDYTQPLSRAEGAAKLKAGMLLSLRDREFDARRFVFRGLQRDPANPDAFNCAPVGGSGYPLDCPDRLFTDENIGPTLSFDEATQPGDSYDANLDVYAGYLMGDLTLLKRIRVLGGARIEATRQGLTTRNAQAGQVETVEVDIDKTGFPLLGDGDGADVLPALAVTLEVTPKANTRFSITRTLARPQLRELAPFTYNNFFGSYQVRGNPLLDLTYITNADLRFEYFPTLREVLAFSVFFKHFKDPIEEVLVPTSERQLITYENAAGAELIGAELEARKTLGFLHPTLDQFTVLSNLTLVKSRVELATLGSNTNASRPMANQSPYVINVSVDYDHEETKTQARLLYNVFGPRLVTVGVSGFEDIYEKPRHLVDLTVTQGLSKHFELKASAQNIFDSPVKQTQKGPDPDGSGRAEAKEYITTHYTSGRSFTIGATYTY